MFIPLKTTILWEEITTLLLHTTPSPTTPKILRKFGVCQEATKLNLPALVLFQRLNFYSFLLFVSITVIHCYPLNPFRLEDDTCLTLDTSTLGHLLIDLRRPTLLSITPSLQCGSCSDQHCWYQLPRLRSRAFRASNRTLKSFTIRGCTGSPPG